MKILQLDLRAFGPFTNEVLDFEADGANLHFVYGPNEAGKTSALRALRQFFYGIPAQSSDDFRHKYKEMRLAAVLEDAQGTRLTCTRRKGNKDTLRDGLDDKPLDPAELSRLLGGLSEDMFQRMFGIDHATLIEGGSEIVQGKGDIGQLLFAAGAGIANLRQIQDALKKEADDLFAPSAKIKPVNIALTELKAAERAVRDSQLKSRDWLELKSKCDESIAHRDSLTKERQALVTEYERLRRFAGALPGIAALSALRRELNELSAARILDKDFSARRVKIRETLTLTKASLSAARREVERLDIQFADVHLPGPLLAQAVAIEKLYKTLGGRLKAIEDRPQRMAEKRQLETEAQCILRRLGQKREIDDVEHLRLSDAEHARISNLAAEHKLVEKAVREANEKLLGIRREVAECETALTTLPAPRSVSELRTALRHAEKQGELEADCREAQENLDKAESQLEVELGRFELWTGTADELEKLGVPGPESIEHFNDRFSAARKRIKTLQASCEAELDEIAGHAAAIEQLRVSSDTPTEEALSYARQRRDAVWLAVRRAWLDGNQDAEEPKILIEEFSPAGDLAEAHEVAVRRADELADRLCRDSTLVERRDNLAASRTKCVAKRDRLAEQLQEAEAELEQTQAQWTALWQPLSITPRTPREMAAWARRQKELSDQARGCREQRDGLARLLARLDSERHSLRACFLELGVPDEDEALASLIERGTGLCDQSDCIETERKELTKSLDRLRAELPRSQEKLQACEDEHARWSRDWKSASERLDLGSGGSPSEANVVLKAVGDLFKSLEKIEALNQRIEGIDADGERFAERVQALVEAVAEDLSRLVPEDAAEKLHGRLADAKTAQAKLASLHEQHGRELEKAKSAEQTITQNEALLAALCDQAGCRVPDELPAAELQSLRRQELDKEIRGKEADLRERAAGAALEVFLAEAESHHPDELDSRIPALAQRIEELEEERTRAIEAARDLKTSFESMNGSAAAADAAERTQELLAELAPSVERFARFRLASAVLGKAIERYRAKNQDPIVDRASALLAELTAGAFAGLKTENDEGQETLIGVRADGEHVKVGHMSDGTADQLYLALRIASLERYLLHAEPVPFIVDDILIMFDNHRAAATLEVLARLSERTQVIFFTHHEHLLDLAAERLDPAAYRVHRLGAPAAALA